MPNVSFQATMDEHHELIGGISQNPTLNTQQMDFGNSPAVTRNYENLLNKPCINGVELLGNIDSDDLGILRPLTTEEMDVIMQID